MTETNEVWKPVPGTDGLIEASSGGKIRSYHPYGKRPVPRTLKAYARSKMKGRLYLCATSRGLKRTPVHRLVASAFYGEIPKGMEVDHINGDVHDNRAENLRVVTRRENHQNRKAVANTGHKNIHKRNDKGTYQVYVDRKYVGTFIHLTQAEHAAELARRAVGYQHCRTT